MATFKYFHSSLAVTLLGLIAAFMLGGTAAVLIVAVLGVLEITLSFDNAVVNATVLKDMDAKWRRRFMTWGMLIAVFGMRIVFPLLIVALAAQVSPVEAVRLALFDEHRYAQILTSAHHQIAAFGGVFLLMVFLRFFVNAHKEEHWLQIIEAPLTRLGRMEAVEVALALLALVISSTFFADITHQVQFLAAGIYGMVTYVVADGLGGLLGGEKGEGAKVVAKSGAAGFMYLELLDASFSFDGVIGAFALTHNLLLIAIGLTVGAMFVRALTLLLVEKGTLSEYRYLEHGAFWAIGALSAVMLAGVHVHIPDAITGSVGAVLIGVAAWSSVAANRRERREAA